MSLISSGAAMRRRLANIAHGSPTVSIARSGETTLTDIAARVGEQQIESDTVGLGIVVVRSCDFLIAQADYDFGSGPVEPAAGDVITSDHTGTAKEYRVGGTAGLSAFEPHDRIGLEWRIHTNQINPAS